MEPKKILIVDDDPDLVLATRLVLESAGYHVDEAPNGEAGLARMREVLPDLVLMDVMMALPLDGYYTTQQIADDPTLSKIPIVMVSSIAASQYAETFPTNQLLSIREFVSKPIDPEQLLGKIKRYLR
ncbi:MAG: response regulator [Anaerolineae bacterium]|jgi:CheY-like chemotaxis protein|nr:response regulator [Anaerolineae bacterium]